MALSAHRPPRASGLTAPRFLLLLLPVAVLAWLWTTRYPPIQEYRLYLVEERIEATLAWEDLSHAWTEARVMAHFKGASVSCMPDDAGIPGVRQVCAVDLRRLNGVPTMTANFLFSDVGLLRVATNIPWWAHRRGLESIVAAHGRPDAGQVRPVAGVRLWGWRLPHQAALFYNRDRDLSPRMTSSIQWTGPRTCGDQPCLLAP